MDFTLKLIVLQFYSTSMQAAVSFRLATGNAVPGPDPIYLLFPAA